MAIGKKQSILKVGVTGHQELESERWVSDSIKSYLAGLPNPLVGISSLAKGADQVFAEELLALGGQLVVVVPCANYEQTFNSVVDKTKYNELLTRASFTFQLDWPRPSEQAFYAAGVRVVDESDELLAVWDGRPPKGLGGTADVVRYCVRVGKPVLQLNPVLRSLTKI